jgi:hypothetical protein
MLANKERLKMCSPKPSDWKRFLTLLAYLNCLAQFCLAQFCLAQTLLAQTDPPADRSPLPELPTREIRVPFEDLSVLLNGVNQRIFMTRAEYESLLKQANLTSEQLMAAQHDRLEKSQIPINTAVLNAAYSIQIETGRALISGDLTIEVLKSGIQAIPLAFQNVGLMDALLDGSPAMLSPPSTVATISSEQNSAPNSVAPPAAFVFIEGTGVRRLSFKMVVPVSSSAAQQTLSCVLPSASANTWSMSVPGNVEIVSGASVLSRQLDTSANTTQFALIPNSDMPRGSALPVSIVMTLNNKVLRETRSLEIRNVILDEITEAYEQIQQRIFVQVLNGAENRFQIEVPNGFEIRKVQSPMMSRWMITDNPQNNAAPQRILVIEMREPVSDQVSIDVVATKASISPYTESATVWTWPVWRVLDAESQTAILGIQLEQGLQLRSLNYDSLIPLDNSFLDKSMPAEMLAREPTAPRVRPIAVLYSPVANQSISGQIAKPTSLAKSNLNLLAVVSESGIRIQAIVDVTAANESIPSLELEIESSWRMQSASMPDGTKLNFDLIEPNRVRIRLSNPIAPNRTNRILFELSSIPTGWLSEWTERSFSFPKIIPRNMEQEITILSSMREGELTLSTTTSENLTALFDSERALLQAQGDGSGPSFSALTPDWKLEITATRNKPQISSEVFSFFKVAKEGIKASYELHLDIKQAATDELRFSLPESAPREITIRGLENAVVKESTSRVVDGRRFWTVKIEKRVLGLAKFSVDFLIDLAKNQEQAMPSIRIDGTIFQTGVMSIEGDDELDVVVVKHPRTADVGELTQSSYVLGNRLLGVYGYNIFDNSSYGSNEDTLSIRTSQRQTQSLPSTIIQRLTLTSALSTNRASYHVAEAQLNSVGGYMQIELPDGATLWSITVDGQPSLPQRHNGQLVVELNAESNVPIKPLGMENGRESGLHQLRIAFEIPIREIGIRTSVDLIAPTFATVQSESGPSEQIPVADTRWQVWMPSELHLSSSVGDLALTYDADADADADALVFPYTLRKYLDLAMESPKLVPTDLVPKSGRFSAEDFFAEKAATRQWQTPRSNAIAENDFSLAPPAGRLDGLAENSFDVPMSLPQIAAPTPTVTNQITLGISPGGGPAQGIAAPSSSIVRTPELRDKSMLNSPDGLKTLPIQFENPLTWHSSQLRGFGNESSISLNLVNNKRLEWAGYAFAALVVAFGFVATSYRVGLVVYWGSVALLLLIAVPLMTPWPYEVGTVAGYGFFATLAIMTLRVVVEMVRRFTAMGKRIANRAIAGPTTFLFAFAMSTLTHCIAQEAKEDKSPILIPADAIVIPYDPNSQSGSRDSDELLVPYSVVTKLWDLAHPDDKQKVVLDAPAEYSLSNLRVTASLERDDVLVVSMDMEIVSHTNKSIFIPFGFEGAALTRATLDGEPASLRTAENALILMVSGAQTHNFSASYQIPITRQGGWRTVNATLPSAPSGMLTLSVPMANTEVRLMGLPFSEQRESTREKESFETVFPQDGRLSVQWRPKMAEIVTDQGISVVTENTLHVEEQGLRANWNVKLEFRRGRRDQFEFELPKDLLVERVVGKNIRGWKIETLENKQLVRVTLLKSAVESEQLSIIASRPQRLGTGEDQFVEVPRLSVPEAMLHQGRITLFRSELIDVRVQESAGLVREDLDAAAPASPSSSPIAMKAFQTYRYSMADYRLKLQVNAIATKIQCQTQTVLRASRNDSQLESEITLTPNGRPLHRVQIQVPGEWQWTVPLAEVSSEWTLSEANNGYRVFDIQFAQGSTKAFTLTLAATQKRNVDEGATEYTAPIPQIRVVQATQEQGELQVFSDPGVAVIPEQLENCQSVGLGVSPNAMSSQSVATSTNLRAIIRTTSGEYKGTLRFKPRTPQVSALSISNVKLTRRSLEETIYMEWNIRDAGVHTIEFTLPERLKDATVLAQMIRNIKRDTATDSGDGKVRFTLELQEDVMGEYRVLVQMDSPLPSGLQSVPIPSNLTGTLESRLVTLENSGNDELVTETLLGISQMARGESQWVKLSSLLGGKSAEAYRVEDSSQVSANEPILTFKSRSRSIVETATARIALAQTTMSVDGAGSYRATQEFRIENTSEAFLEVEMPSGAKLWSVLVAKKPVKPIESPNKATRPGARRLRLPLVRTQTGDLDYGVELKYAGNLNRPNLTSKLDFPLVESININVELSQMKLFLPENQLWYGFDGTLGRVEDEADLLAGWLSQKNKQLSRLSALAANDSESFSQARADENFKQLEQQVQAQLNNSVARQTKNDLLQKQVQSNEAVVMEAKKQGAQALGKSSQYMGDNRASFNSLFESQSNSRASGNLDLQVRNTFENMESKGKEWKDLSKALPQKGAAAKPNSMSGMEGRKSDSKDSRSLAESYKGKIQNGSMQQQSSFGANSANGLAGLRSGSGGSVQSFDPSTVQTSNQPSFVPVPQFVEPNKSDGYNAGYASLDVALEMRGKPYYFSTPRGVASLSVSGVSKSIVWRGSVVFAVLAILGMMTFLRRRLPKLHGAPPS